jgi:hypothetical protein
MPFLTSHSPKLTTKRTFDNDSSSLPIRHFVTVSSHTLVIPRPKAEESQSRKAEIPRRAARDYSETCCHCEPRRGEAISTVGERLRAGYSAVGLRPPRNDRRPVSVFKHIAIRRYGILGMTDWSKRGNRKYDSTDSFSVVVPPPQYKGVGNVGEEENLCVSAPCVLALNSCPLRLSADGGGPRRLAAVRPDRRG